MSARNPLWDFTSLIPAVRRQRLLAIQSFQEVIERVVRGTTDFFATEPRGNAPCLGCSRAFLRVRVDELTYDAFFNSPIGYRAQYCLSTENGEEQNRRLIAAITPMCLSYSEGKEQNDFLTDKILASLRGIDAKAWIKDSDLPDVNEVHIDYGPWVAKATVVSRGTPTDKAARAKAAVGVLAPVGTHIEIKGAWLTPDGRECRDPSKALRAQEIHDYGYT